VALAPQPSVIKSEVGINTLSRGVWSKTHN